MHFTRLFTHLPYSRCDDSVCIQIDKADVISIHSKAKVKKSANSLTIDKVKNMVENWEPFTRLTPDLKKYIQQIFAARSFKNTDVTVGFIRTLYNQIIAAQLTGFEKCAANADTSYDQRIKLDKNNSPIALPIYFYGNKDKKEWPKDNETALKEYLPALEQNWGAKRVKRALECTESKFDAASKRQLLCGHISKIRTALNDVHYEDVEDTYKALRACIAERLTLDQLPHTIFHNLHKALGCSTCPESLAKLKSRFKDLPEVFGELKNSDDIKFFINLLAPSYDDLEMSLLGHRLEGVMYGSYPTMNKKTIQYDKGHEDKERAQVYQEIYQMQGQWKDWETTYVELLCKFLVKKELCLHGDSNDHRHVVKSGMLIPAPCGEWYRIENKFHKDGKQALFLTPVGNSERPSMIIYMSTASSPSHTHSVETIAHDATPSAPGIYGRHLDDKEVEEFYLKSKGPLIIAGHSLGGSFAQYRLADTLNIHVEDKWDLIPPRMDSFMHHTRTIRMMCFDPPAPRKEDAESFAKWAHDYPELAKLVHIDYYISEKDIVPGGGARHIGYGCENTAVQVHLHLLDVKAEIDEKELQPELQFLPHGRFYFRSKKVIDQTKHTHLGALGLNQYDDAKWRRHAEIFRLFLVCILLPLTLLFLCGKWSIQYMQNWWQERKIKKMQADPKVEQVAGNTLS